jgi:YD repeat-containing protein
MRVGAFELIAAEDGNSRQRPGQGRFVGKGVILRQRAVSGGVQQPGDNINDGRRTNGPGSQAAIRVQSSGRAIRSASLHLSAAGADQGGRVTTVQAGLDKWPIRNACRSPRYIAPVEIGIPVSLFPSAHAVGVQPVSEKNADAEKHQQDRDSLGHRLALSRTMPGIAALRNSR